MEQKTKEESYRRKIRQLKKVTSSNNLLRNESSKYIAINDQDQKLRKVARSPESSGYMLRSVETIKSYE
jgi:hypothetical protein